MAQGDPLVPSPRTPDLTVQLESGPDTADNDSVRVQDLQRLTSGLNTALTRIAAWQSPKGRTRKSLASLVELAVLSIRPGSVYVDFVFAQQTVAPNSKQLREQAMRSFVLGISQLSTEKEFPESWPPAIAASFRYLRPLFKSYSELKIDSKAYDLETVTLLKEDVNIFAPPAADQMEAERGSSVAYRRAESRSDPAIDGIGLYFIRSSEQLMNLARLEFNHAGLSLSPTVERQFAGIVLQMLVRMTHDGRVEHGDLVEAEGALVRLVARVDDHTRKAGIAGPSDELVEMALKGLCPLWPIC